MKKRVLSKLLLALVTASLLLSGCGAEETDGSAESSQVEREQESTEQVEKEIEDASFTWNVSDKDLYLLMRRQLEVKPSWFLGTATYTDGTTGSIEADRIDLGRDGLILLVDVYYGGGESVRYQIEVPEMWEDMNLNEQSQEDIEAWYEGLGGDSSQVNDSTATEIHDWDTTIKDFSNEDFSTMVQSMCGAYKTWNDALTMDSRTEIKLAQLDQTGEFKKAGEDVYYNVEYKEDSEWFMLYGNSSLSEVSKEANVPDYGIPCECYCTYGNHKDFCQAISDYFNLGYDYSADNGVEVDNSESWLSLIVRKIPLSSHNARQLSMEELRAYLVEVYKYYQSDSLLNGSEDYEYYEEPHLLRLYGLEEDVISQKFSKYFVSGHPSLKSIYQVYEILVENYGYNGSIFDFYALDSGKLDSMILQVMIDGAEADNWVIDEDIANIIKSLGGEVPESATIIVDSESETTESKPEVTLNEEDIPPLNDPIR